MERWFGLLLILGVLYAGIELYTKGDQAFGGVFASSDAPAQESEPWAGERAGARLSGGHEQRSEQMGRALGE